MRSKLFHAILLLIIVITALSADADRRRTRSGFSKAGSATQKLGSARFLPADCFLYIQFRDLATQIKTWKRSGLQDRYYKSKSYELWQQRHLAGKLSNRLEEFEQTLGSSLTLDAIAGVTGKEASIAVYNIGDTQFIFVTELNSTEKLLTDLLPTDRFTEKSLSKGQKYYVGESGEKFQACYAVIDKHLIVATKERLLVDALNIILGESNEKRLDELPAFKQLTSNAKEFHDITMWLDQERINEDWYFRNYWIYQNFEALKPFSAGLVDLEMADDSWIERRYFLIKENGAAITPANAEEVRRIASAVPRNTAAYRIDAVSEDETVKIIADTIFDYQPKIKNNMSGEQPIESRFSYQSEDYDYTYQSGNTRNDDEGGTYYYQNFESERYTDLSSVFNVDIDNPLLSDSGQKEQSDFLKKQSDERSQIISSVLLEGLKNAHPCVAARFARQEFESNNYFVIFDRGAIIKLANPSDLDRRKFEKALEEAVRLYIVASISEVDLQWRSESIAGTELRSLTLPLIGRGVSYAVKGDLLMLFNRPEYGVLALTRTTDAPELAGNRLTSYRVVRPNLGRSAFLKLFNQLDAGEREERNYDGSDSEKSEQEIEEERQHKLQEAFFSGNIASLLTVTSNVREVAIESDFRDGELNETIIYRLESKPHRLTKK